MGRGGGEWRWLAERAGSLEERSSACERGLLITTNDRDHNKSNNNNNSNNNTSTITNIIKREGGELGRELDNKSNNDELVSDIC